MKPLLLSLLLAGPARAEPSVLSDLETGALQALVELAHDPEISPQVRLDAATEVLARVDHTRAKLEAQRARHVDPVLVVSGDARLVELTDGKRSYRQGDAVPPGLYTVLARFHEARMVSAGTVVVHPDEPLSVRCASFVQMCR